MTNEREIVLAILITKGVLLAILLIWASRRDKNG